MADTTEPEDYQYIRKQEEDALVASVNTQEPIKHFVCQSSNCGDCCSGDCSASPNYLDDFNGHAPLHLVRGLPCTYSFSGISGPLGGPSDGGSLVGKCGKCGRSTTGTYSLATSNPDDDYIIKCQKCNRFYCNGCSLKLRQ